MTANTFIVTSHKADLEALRYQGILVSESWAQIISSLEKNLSPRHAAIFATPYISGDSATIDWYSEALGPVKAWADLAPESRRQALDTLKALGEEIAALAREMKTRPDEASVTRGNIIDLALRYPSPDNIFMVGSQPVLTGWGFVSASAHSQPEYLLRAGLAPQEAAAWPEPKPAALSMAEPVAPLATEPAAEAAAGAPPRLAPESGNTAKKLSFPLFLLPLLLAFLPTIALLYALSFIPGCSDFSLWRGCSPREAAAPAASPENPAPNLPALPADRVAPRGESSPAPRAEDSALGVPSSPALNREAEELARREPALRARLDELRLKLMQRASQCPSALQPEPAQPEPPSLGQLLPQTRPEAEPETRRETRPLPEPETLIQRQRVEETIIEPETRRETRPQPEPETELAIPEQAREKNDLSFLGGCWLSSSQVYNDETGEALVIEYCFEENGGGSRVVRDAGGKRCAGPLQAGFDESGRLIIDAGAAACDNGRSYAPQRVECSGSGNSTDCQGQELSPAANKWQARFRRQ